MAGRWFKPKGLMPNRRTPIEEWPREWLELIEPKILRGPTSEGDHWYWSGYEMRGIPYITYGKVGGGRGRISVASLIVQMFWRLHPYLQTPEHTEVGGSLWYVERTCGYKNCVNPQHLAPRCKADGEPHDDEEA